MPCSLKKRSAFLVSLHFLVPKICIFICFIFLYSLFLNAINFLNILKISHILLFFSSVLSNDSWKSPSSLPHSSGAPFNPLFLTKYAIAYFNQKIAECIHRKSHCYYGSVQFRFCNYQCPSYHNPDAYPFAHICSAIVFLHFVFILSCKG